MDAPQEPAPTAGGAETAGTQNTGDFVVTEEIFTRTFDEIEGFINELNEIIRNRDYTAWISYLSKEYIRRTSDRAFLAAQSEAPVLKKANIELEDLRDYFEYVVVPSRSHAQLDDIEFIDETHVKAISNINDTRGLLYLLVRDNDSWYVGVW